MSNGIATIVIYSLLIFIQFLLKIIHLLAEYLILIPTLLLQSLLNLNMTETTKRKPTVDNNQTVTNRGVINANWQKLLSSNLIEKKESINLEEKKEHYTGTFRRSRAKKHENTFSNDIKSLEITTENKVRNNNNRNSLTKFVAMDCEMVGIGYNGNDDMLARVSLVNKFGDCIYDKFVKPREEVIDYRTEVSGVRKEDLITGEDFTIVQKEVAEIIKGRVLVGHSVNNDLKVLFLSHPKRNLRDTSKYKPFRQITKGRTPSLKQLTKEILNIHIQHGEHNSVEDAKATMQLYCTVAKNWENSLSTKRGYSKKSIQE